MSFFSDTNTLNSKKMGYLSATVNTRYALGDELPAPIELRELSQRRLQRRIEIEQRIAQGRTIVTTFLGMDAEAIPVYSSGAG